MRYFFILFLLFCAAMHFSLNKDGSASADGSGTGKGSLLTRFTTDCSCKAKPATSFESLRPWLKEAVVFVCRSYGELSVVNVKSATTQKLMYTLKDGFYFGVIPYDKLLICYVRAGIQFVRRQECQ
jgi:hypothetical protein